MDREKRSGERKRFADFFSGDTRIGTVIFALVLLLTTLMDAPWATIATSFTVMYLIWSLGYWLLPRLLRRRRLRESLDAEREMLSAAWWDSLWTLICGLLLLAVNLAHYLLRPVPDWHIAYLIVAGIGVAVTLWCGCRISRLSAKLRKTEK